MKAIFKGGESPILKSYYEIGSIVNVKKISENTYQCLDKGFWFDTTELELELLSDLKTDPIVNQVIDKFKERSEKGIQTYGTTLHDNNTDDFLTHLQEELMDAVLYIQKLKDGNDRRD